MGDVIRQFSPLGQFGQSETTCWPRRLRDLASGHGFHYHACRWPFQPRTIQLQHRIQNRWMRRCFAAIAGNTKPVVFRRPVTQAAGVCVMTDGDGASCAKSVARFVSTSSTWTSQTGHHLLKQLEKHVLMLFAIGSVCLENLDTPLLAMLALQDSAVLSLLASSI